MQEIGILLPQDVLAYMVLRKLPHSFKVIKQQVTHSKVSSEITPDAVLDHLRINLNEQRFNSSAENGGSLSGPVTALFTDPLGKCKTKKHNTLANHPEHKCWMLYTHLRPKNNSRAQAYVSTPLCFRPDSLLSSLILAVPIT